VDATRARILRAARDVVVANGYHSAALERVAHGAGVTRITVYRQFGSKRGLLEALTDDLAASSDVVAHVEAARAIPDAIGALTALVHSLAQLWATDPALLRRLVGLAAVDPDAAAIISGREHWRHERVQAFTERLVEAHRIRSPFDRVTATASIEAVTAFSTCDALAEQAGLPHDRLGELLLALLRSVVEFRSS